LRDTSPLTVLGSEDEDEEAAAQLQEEIRGREDELEEMRRELAAVRRRPSTNESEADDNIRFATPSPSMFVQQYFVLETYLLNQALGLSIDRRRRYRQLPTYSLEIILEA